MLKIRTILSLLFKNTLTLDSSYEYNRAKRNRKDYVSRNIQTNKQDGACAEVRHEPVESRKHESSVISEVWNIGDDD